MVLLKTTSEAKEEAVQKAYDYLSSSGHRANAPQATVEGPRLPEDLFREELA